MAALLKLAGDIESNPGPKTQQSSIHYICPVCLTKLQIKREKSVQCHHPSHTTLYNQYVHYTKCSQLNPEKPTPSWICPAHNSTTLSTPQPHITQPLPQPLSQPPTLPKQPLTSKHTPAPKTFPTYHKQTSATPQDNSSKTKLNKNITKINILQCNINAITNKSEEFKDLILANNITIATIQESKLTAKSKTPIIPGYSTIRKDRTQDKGGGLLTFIRHDIMFTETQIPASITNNKSHIELQVLKILLSNKKALHIANLYIPPRDPNSSYTIEDPEITNCFSFLLSLDNLIITSDANAHSDTWHSPTTDHRGTLIQDLIQNSDQIILNQNTPTRIPGNKNQQPTSPDITTISSNFAKFTTWQTITALSSDHIPIMITINTKANTIPQHTNRCYTNYRKANWKTFTEEIETTLSDSATPTNTHTGNQILTNAILLADKHNIPKGKLNSHHTPLPEHIGNKIKLRNSTRTANPKDPNIQTLNIEINKLISNHKENQWKEKLSDKWDHKTNTFKYWKTLDHLAGKSAPSQPNRIIQFNNKDKSRATNIAQSFNKQFVNSTPHKTNKINRSIDRKTKNLKSDKDSFQVTIEQVQIAIKSTKNSNSLGPDKTSIHHLKHLGPIALQYLTNLFNLSIQSNTIPHIWKLAKIIPIPKPNKDPKLGASYRPISLLSPIAKCLEKTILPTLTQHLPSKDFQHGFKSKHSTVTALQNITNTIAKGFNQKAPPKRTILVSLDMSKAFDTVNIHTLVNKLQETTTPPTLIKYVANYIKGRKAFTQYNNANSKQQTLRTGVPQGGVLSPILFNLYVSDIPQPPPNVQLESYADDLNPLSSHENIHKAESALQPYLNELFDWTVENDLQLNPTKSSCTLFSPDPAEQETQLQLSINNQPIPTTKHPKILGVTFDTKLTFNEHIKNVKLAANKSINILKSLTSTTWGKQKETLVATYNAITRPILEYGSTVWSPIIADTNMQKLQTIQNTALRIATGCTADTNVNHLHQETLTLPLKNHCQLHASNLKQKAASVTHPLNKLMTQPALEKPRKNNKIMKESLFQTNTYIINPPITNCLDDNEIDQNIKTNHRLAVNNYKTTLPDNKILEMPAPTVHQSEESLNRYQRRLLSQLRTNKSPFLLTYLHKIDPIAHPSPLCPLCTNQPHNTQHLFQCSYIQTTLTPIDLWHRPCETMELLEAWQRALDDAPSQPQ